jgi:hypothetical protein
MSSFLPGGRNGHVRRRWLAVGAVVLLVGAVAKVWWNGQNVVLVLVNDGRASMASVQVRSVLGEAGFDEVLPEGSVSCRLAGEDADRELEITWVEEGQDRSFVTHGHAGERLVVRTYSGAEPLVSRSPGLWLRIVRWE